MAKTAHYQEDKSVGYYMIGNEVYDHNTYGLNHSSDVQNLNFVQQSTEKTIFDEIKEKYMLFSHPENEIKDFSYQLNARTLVYSSANREFTTYSLNIERDEYIYGHCNMKESRILLLVKKPSHFEFRLILPTRDFFSPKDTFEFKKEVFLTEEETINSNLNSKKGPEVVYWKSQDPFIWVWLKNQDSKYLNSLYLFKVENDQIILSKEVDLTGMFILDMEDQYSRYTQYLDERNFRTYIHICRVEDQETGEVERKLFVSLQEKTTHQLDLFQMMDCERINPQGPCFLKLYRTMDVQLTMVGQLSGHRLVLIDVSDLGNLRIRNINVVVHGYS